MNQSIRIIESSPFDTVNSSPVLTKFWRFCPTRRTPVRWRSRSMRGSQLQCSGLPRRSTDTMDLLVGNKAFVDAVLEEGIRICPRCCQRLCIGCSRCERLHLRVCHTQQQDHAGTVMASTRVSCCSAEMGRSRTPLQYPSPKNGYGTDQTGWLTHPWYQVQPVSVMLRKGDTMPPQRPPFPSSVL